MVAVEWVVQYFKVYLYGKKSLYFTFHTENKSLIPILMKKTNDTSARLERLRCKLQGYIFLSVHMKCSSNSIGFISRPPTISKPCQNPFVV